MSEKIELSKREFAIIDKTEVDLTYYTDEFDPKEKTRAVHIPDLE